MSPKCIAYSVRDADFDTIIGILPGNTEVWTASVESGRQLLKTVDDFVTQQSQFDRQARVNLQREVLEVTSQLYLDYVGSQVMSWSQKEVKALKSIVTDLVESLLPLSLNLPPKIYLVKTTGQEEGFAAYTRRHDTIVLPANMVASIGTTADYGDPLHPASDLSFLRNIIIHECFHLFSKNNPAKRCELYQKIGYQLTGTPVELPASPWGISGSPMRDLKITNPDEPGLDVYVELVVPSVPSSPESPPVKSALAPILLAKSPYVGGIFFDYLEWWFMAIAQGSDGRWGPVVDKTSGPLMYESGPLINAYLSLISGNFKHEIFQPDEILAQNFVLVVNQPSLDILTTMRQILST